MEGRNRIPDRRPAYHRNKAPGFILLSDTLGVSAMSFGAASALGRGTDSSLLGPFYRDGAPEQPLGASIAGNTPGEALVLRGRVADALAAARRRTGRMFRPRQRRASRTSTVGMNLLEGFAPAPAPFTIPLGQTEAIPCRTAGRWECCFAQDRIHVQHIYTL
jgi:hypothetical protein